MSVATPADVPAYADAMSRSSARIGRWNPVNPNDLVHHLAAQSPKHRTFLVRAEPDVRHTGDAAGLVGCVNVTNVVQGRFMSATMGYNAFDPYAGTGMFGEGLRLVVDVALRAAPSGMGLHRVEANVRVGNAASAGLLRSLGFRRERTVRRMLWLTDGLSGPSAWRDHDSYAVTREEWPAPGYAAHDQPGGVIVLGGGTNVPVAVAVARDLGAVALFDLPYEPALAVAARSGAPVIWHAGGESEKAMRALAHLGITASRGDDAMAGASTDPRDVARTALALRPLLQ